MINRTLTAQIGIMFALLALFFLLASPVIPQEAEKPEVKSAESKEKVTYLVTSPHTQEECLATLEAIAEKDAKSLENWRWGCKAGDHTGYAYFKAESEESALQSVPEMVRAKAKAQKVDKFTADEIKAAHGSKSQSKK